MKFRDKLIIFICLLLCIAMLVAAGSQLDYINTTRKDMNLVINEPLENAPPSLAFASVAMGAFRGLVVDILWLRADRLKDQGQFFDAKQLAEWITVLQPRFAAVWQFQAWNMAYNISVAIPASQPEQRWRWVKNGIELIRDQGIEMNPKNILLYREIAFIYQHKIGSVSDDVHKYYKLQLAESIAPLLSPAGYTEPMLGPEGNVYFDQLAKAPGSLEQITQDPNYAKFIDDLKKADNVFDDESKLVGNYLSLRQNSSRFKPEAARVIDSFRGSKVLKNFDYFARAYQLKNVWKLDPNTMREMNRTIGPTNFADPNTRLPLDWRHPDSHALYWAIKGLKLGSKEEFSIDEINTDRIVNHSLQNLYRKGRIFIYNRNVEDASEQSGSVVQKQKEIFLRPDLRMFDAYNKSALANINKYRNIKKKGSFESLQTGHRNMLTNAVFSYYQAGHVKEARKIFLQLRKLYPSERNDMPFVVFVKKRFQEELKGLQIFDALEMVQLLLRESYFRYALRDDDDASDKEKLAKEIHDFYMTSNKEEYRIDLPDFKVMLYAAMVDFLNDAQYSPELRKSLVDRIKIERPDLSETFTEIEEKAIQNQNQQNNLE